VNHGSEAQGIMEQLSALAGCGSTSASPSAGLPPAAAFRHHGQPPSASPEGLLHERSSRESQTFFLRASGVRELWSKDQPRIPQFRRAVPRISARRYTALTDIAAVSPVESGAAPDRRHHART
jgi:hypothetical protein